MLSEPMHQRQGEALSKPVPKSPTLFKPLPLPAPVLNPKPVPVQPLPATSPRRPAPAMARPGPAKPTPSHRDDADRVLSSMPLHCGAVSIRPGLDRIYAQQVVPVAPVGQASWEVKSLVQNGHAGWDSKLAVQVEQAGWDAMSLVPVGPVGWEGIEDSVEVAAKWENDRNSLCYPSTARTPTTATRSHSQEAFPVFASKPAARSGLLNRAPRARSYSQPRAEASDSETAALWQITSPMEPQAEGCPSVSPVARLSRHLSQPRAETWNADTCDAFHSSSPVEPLCRHESQPRADACSSFSPAARLSHHYSQPRAGDTPRRHSLDAGISTSKAPCGTSALPTARRGSSSHRSAPIALTPFDSPLNMPAKSRVNGRWKEEASPPLGHRIPCFSSHWRPQCRAVHVSIDTGEPGLQAHLRGSDPVAAKADDGRAWKHSTCMEPQAVAPGDGMFAGGDRSAAKADGCGAWMRSTCEELQTVVPGDEDFTFTEELHAAALAASGGEQEGQENDDDDSFIFNRPQGQPIPGPALRWPRAKSIVHFASDRSEHCRQFCAQELEAATDRWSPNNILGKGSFGHVYKGTFDDMTVAIKKLDVQGNQGPGEYCNEVQVLSNIEHPNIVRLLGHCPETHCLVYEYISQGTLHNWLQDSKRRATLSWQARVDILAGLASALVALHEASPPVVHRDLKPENVLLDDRLAAKLADVGLARLLGSDENGNCTYTVSGTAGYIDPDAMKTFIISPSADVYAYGLIMLQMLMGEPRVQTVHNLLAEVLLKPSGQHLLAAAMMVTNNVDQSAGAWPEDVTNIIAQLALKCINRYPPTRPSLAEVVIPTLQRLCTL